MSSFFKYTIETEKETKISSLYIENYIYIVLTEDFIKTIIIKIYEETKLKYGLLNIYIDDELWIITDYQMFGFNKILTSYYENKINNSVYHKFYK